MTGLLLAAGLPLLGALALLAWEAASPANARRVAPWLTVTLLLLAFACCALPVTSTARDVPVLRSLMPDALSVIARGLLLLGMALRLLVTPPFAPHAAPTPEPPAAHFALRLLAAAGGTLALSGNDLALIALGLTLFSVADRSQRARGDASHATVQSVGIGALFFGVSLLYAGTATLDLGVLGPYLWAHPGPQAALLYTGVGLTVVGCTLVSGLASPLPGATRDASSAVLGVGVLLRVCAFGLGALQPVGGWLAAAVGLVAMLAGWLRSRRLWGEERLRVLDSAQRGLLLLTLAFAHTPAGLQAALMALLAYWLAEFVATTTVRRLRAAGPGGADYAGLLGRDPWMGTALLISLASLAGMPLTLGFAGRAALPWAAPDRASLALAIVAVVLSALCAADYLQEILRLARSGAEDAPLREPELVHALLLVAALALLVLGVFPQPFGAWVAAIAG